MEVVNKHEMLVHNAREWGFEFGMAKSYACNECKEQTSCIFAWDAYNYNESILDCLGRVQ